VRQALEARARPEAQAVLSKAHDDLIKAERHTASAKAESEPASRAERLASVRPDDPRLAEFDDAERERYAFFDLRGHLYKTRDRTAGVRHYARRTKADGPSSKEKFTEGGQLLMGTCDHLGAPIAVLAESVGVQEWEAYPGLLDKVEAAVGDAADAVVTDKGFHIRSVFELNTRHGISTIAPWRQPRPGLFPEDLECARYDRHGVVRCWHCGGATHMHGAGLGLNQDANGEPRLRVQCSQPHTPRCHRPQSIACKEEWRLLQPINRTEQLYHDLLQAHSNKESLFHHWRRRYAVAGNDFAERPKRRQSVPCQALRAAAGLLVEWLRLCLRHGWLGSHRTINRADIEVREGGRGDWAKVWESRRDLDLDLPCGRRRSTSAMPPTSTRPASGNAARSSRRRSNRQSLNPGGRRPTATPCLSRQRHGTELGPSEPLGKPGGLCTSLRAH
jgi:hypothetical protein